MNAMLLLTLELLFDKTSQNTVATNLVVSLQFVSSRERNLLKLLSKAPISKLFRS